MLLTLKNHFNVWTLAGRWHADTNSQLKFLPRL